MEAKDTVMKVWTTPLTNDNWDEGGGFTVEAVESALVEQAGISFKAGQVGQKLVCSKCENAGSCANTEGCLEVIESENETFRAGIKEVVEGQKHIDGKVTGDLECFCMVKPDECDDPHDMQHFPLNPMYPSDIAEGEGRLIFVPKAKLKEWTDD